MASRLPAHGIKIRLARDGPDVRITAEGSHENETRSHLLGVTREQLEAFAKEVGHAALRGEPLDAAALEEAQRLHDALLRGEVRDLVASLCATSDRVLVRLMIEDRVLQAIPWEALCRPGTSEGFVATGEGGLLVARGVTCSKPWAPRAVEGALRVQVLAPSSDERALGVLQDALASSGITWLDPIAGKRAARRYLFDLLRKGPSPHVLHFLGHGGLDVNGHPTLRLADDEDGEEDWIKAEVLARELEATLVGDDLRLVVLEACEGARPGVLGSAAEILARTGVDAVIAHLWPVKADVARGCSASFYRALTAGERTRGDVAASLAAARRSLLVQHRSAEGFSPILYMRGADPVLFDFGARREAPFHVPFLRNPSFVGRDDDLASLHALLQKGGAVGVRPAALTGMGGIGKTQLAVEYVYRYANAYPGGVYWVNAAEPLSAQFARLALDVGLGAGDASESERQGRLARAFAKYLGERPEALVIFDNVEDPIALRNAEPGFIPAQLGCRLLFTTRRRDLRGDFASVEVRVLPAEASVELLLSGRGPHPPVPCALSASTPSPFPFPFPDRERERERERVGPEALNAHGGWGGEGSEAVAICRMLGHLPLAIALAAAYLDQNPEIALADYRGRLAREGVLATVDDSDMDALDLPTRHDAAVGATLRLQWRALEGKTRKNEDARLVLTAASILGEAAQVPRARLGLLTGLLDRAEGGYPARLGSALRALSGLSLVEELSEHEIRLHPLVREFAETTIAGKEGFRAACGERLGDALRGMARLHAEVAARGVDAVLADLRVGEGMVGADGRKRLEEMIRRLDREAHCLRRWDAEGDPGFLLQQVRNRYLEMGLGELQELAEAYLKEKGWLWLRERIQTSRESEALVRTLEGHTSVVNGAVVTPDGRFAVSASWDNTLKVWDLGTGQALRTLEGHTSDVTGVAVTPDGRFAVSASWDKTLKVWDLGTGQAIRTLEGHTAFVNGAAVTADGRFAVSASSDKTLKVWDLGTGQAVRTLEGHTEGVNGVAVTSDGRFAVSASEDKALKVWDLGTGETVRTLEGHTEGVSGVTVTADGRVAVSASGDETLKVWDIGTGQAVRTLEGHTEGVNGVAVTADSCFAVSGSLDHMLKVWDPATGQEVRTLQGHTDGVMGVAVTADGRFVVSASRDRTLKVWDLGTGQTVHTPEGHVSTAYGVAVTADGRFAVSASRDHTLKVWDLGTGQVVRTLEGHISLVTGVAVTADGRFAVSASSDHTLEVWDLGTGQAVRTLEGHTQVVTGVAVTPDGRFAVSTSYDSTLKMWDLARREAVRTLEGHTGFVTGVAVTPDGHFAVSASWDHRLKVWDLDTGQAVRTLEGHTHYVTGVAVTAGGRFAVSASLDKTLKVWDLGTGQVIRTLEGHTDEVNCVAVTADGRFVVSASKDKTLKLWDLSTGYPLATLEAHAPLWCCAVTPDGRTLLAGDEAGALHILDILPALPS